MDQYPSVYQHLLLYKPQLSARNKAETGIRYEWYALQRWGANYSDDFSQPKIVWGNLCLAASYALVDKEYFVNAPSPMIIPASKYLLAILNSRLADFYIQLLGVTRNGGYFEYKPVFVEQLPVPVLKDGDPYLLKLEALVDSLDYQAIDQSVYDLYGLSEDERDYLGVV